MNCRMFQLVVLVSVLVGGCCGLDDAAPVWRRMIPGQTTEQQVIRTMGEPGKRDTDVLGLGLDAYIYPSKAGLGDPHYILLENGVVRLISARKDGDETALTHLSEFLDRYGEPEKVTWTAWTRYGSGTRSFIYAGEGLVVTAGNSVTAPYPNVFRIDYFEPMPLEGFVDTYGTLFPGENPFPLQDGRPEDYYSDPEHPYRYDD